MAGSTGGPSARRRQREGGCVMRSARWFAGITVTVLAPAAAVVAGVVYLLLRRRWSDRLVATVLVLSAIVGGLVAATVCDYPGAWLHLALHLSQLSTVDAGAADWATLIVG